MNENKSLCFRIESISIFILVLLLFFYTLGIFIYSLLNLIDNNQEKIVLKNGNLYTKYKNKKIQYDYDSIYLKNDIKVNIYEK